MRTPRQELYLEIARTERMLHDALDDLQRHVAMDRSDEATRTLIERCRALTAQLHGAVGLLGPGDNEDATRAAAASLSERLATLVGRIARPR